jgi:hypothetical protein
VEYFPQENIIVKGYESIKDPVYLREEDSDEENF